MRNASALKPRVVTVLSRADVMDVCQVMLHRCGLSAAQLAQHMGEPLQAPSAAAPKPAANPAAPITPRTAEALGFAARPEGASISDLQQLMGISMQTAFAYLDTLAKRGLVTRAKAPGTRNWKYFAEGAAAQALAKHPQADCKAPTLAAPPPPAAASRGLKSARREVTFHKEFTGVQRAATPVDKRFAVGPDDPLTGGFSTSKPGINPLTGQPWSAA